MTYSINLARERFSLWAPSRAAQAGSAKAERGEFIAALKSCGVLKYLSNPANHAATLALYDTEFDQWEVRVQRYLQTKCKKPVMYGVAAKLVSTYLKSAFVLGGFESTPLARHITPPIDSFLLFGLMEKRGANFGTRTKWQKFTQQDYRHVVGVLRALSGDAPAWRLEEYWEP